MQRPDCYDIGMLLFHLHDHTVSSTSNGHASHESHIYIGNRHFMSVYLHSKATVIHNRLPEVVDIDSRPMDDNANNQVHIHEGGHLRDIPDIIVRYHISNVAGILA